MKKFLLISSVAFVSLILIGLLSIFLIFPKVSPASNLKVAMTPERIARGRYLAEGPFGCVSCHSPRQPGYTYPTIPEKHFAGGADFSTMMDGIPGTVAPQNLTPTHLEKWTDGEIHRAITAGVSRDGRPLFPIMPFAQYGKATEEDVQSIIAYLRSLKPLPGETPVTKIGGPMAIIMRFLPADPTPSKSPTTPLERGKYLAEIGCMECHTPTDDKHRPIPELAGAGGKEFPMKDRTVIRSANITPDEDTGIGRWTSNQFVQVIRERGAMVRTQKIDPSAPNSLMPYEEAARMTDGDLHAIYTYFRSLKPIHQAVSRWQKI